MDASYGTNDFTFVIDALSNQRLKVVTLNLTDNSFPSTDLECLAVQAVYNTIGDRIKCLVGLAELKLSIEVNSVNDVQQPLLLAILQNPTLRNLKINLGDEDNELELPTQPQMLEMNNVLRRNKVMTYMSHEYPVDSELAIAFKQTIISNRQLQANLTPILKDTWKKAASGAFGNDFLAFDVSQLSTPINTALVSHSSLELISAQNILFSILENPDKKSRVAHFPVLLSSLVIFQALVSRQGTSKPMYHDIATLINEFCTRQDIAKLSRVTGGYFFREKKRLLAIQNNLAAAPGSVATMGLIAAAATEPLARNGCLSKKTKRDDTDEATDSKRTALH